MRFFENIIELLSNITFFFNGSFNNLFFKVDWSHNDIILGLTGFFRFYERSNFVFENIIELYI